MFTIVQLNEISYNFNNDIGVYIRLNGTSYPNNSNIVITDIGQGEDGALYCITDLIECCQKNQTTTGTTRGEWLDPNGEEVGLISTNETFYKKRGRSKVYIYRRAGSILPVGKFCCEVPDATYTDITVCVNIGE